MHLACKSVCIRPVVGITVAVVMAVAVHNIVVRAIRTVILAHTGERIRELMPETELKTRVEVITELATLNTVVGAFEFDSVVGSVHDMQAEHDPMVAGQVYASVADIGRLAVAVKQLLLEVEDRFLVFVGSDNDRFLSCTGLLEANREFAVCAAP